MSSLPIFCSLNEQNTKKDYSPEPIPKITNEHIKNQSKITNQKAFEEITCIICEEFPIEPVKCKHCSVIMCTNCFHVYMTNSNSNHCCPQRCTKNLMEVEIATEKLKEIDNFLKLKCIQCGEIIVYSKYKSHLEICKEKKFHCNSESCFFISNENKMKEHVKICPNKKIPCEFCNILIKRKNIDTHLKYQCTKKTVKCPKCDKIMIEVDYNKNHKSINNTNINCLHNQIDNLVKLNNYLIRKNYITEKNFIVEKNKNILLENELTSLKGKYTINLTSLSNEIKVIENELNKEREYKEKLKEKWKLVNEKYTQLSIDFRSKVQVLEEEKDKNIEWGKKYNQINEENSQLICKNELLQKEISQKNKENIILANEINEIKKEFEVLNKKFKTELESNIKLKENLNVDNLKIEDLLNKLILLDQVLKKEKEKSIDLEKLNKSTTFKLQKDYEIKINEFNIQKNVVETKLNKTMIEYNDLRNKFKEEKFKKEIPIKISPIISSEISYQNKFKFLIKKNKFLLGTLFIHLIIIGLYDIFFKENDYSKA